MEDEQEKPADPTKQTEPTGAIPVPPAKPKSHRLKAFLATTKGKIIAAALVLLAILGILMIIPATRYAILGAFIKKDVTLMVMDSETKKPVTEAQISLGSQTVTTDNQGHAVLHKISVGHHPITIQKKYYNTQQTGVDVWITKPATPAEFNIEATGRQVPVRVINKISQQPIENATIAVADTTATTDVKGEATIVLPADQTDVDGEIKADGYNNLPAKVKVTEQTDEANTFALTPSGKLYYLSKRTGKVDVMKSDLDGSNAQTVLAGTGKESEAETILVASRDWKHLALKARRDDGKAKLYVISAENDQLATMDEGNANFTMLGWADHRFVYQVDREGQGEWDESRQLLKSYNADDKSIIELDHTAGDPAAQVREYYAYHNTPILVGNELFFNKEILYTFGNQVGDKKRGVYKINADGTNRQTLMQADPTSGYFVLKTYKPTELFIRDYIYQTAKSTYHEYEDGQLKDATLTDQDFEKAYPVYLYSPDGNQTFWSDSRDGKNTLLLGNKEGEDEKTLAALVDYRQYGWYTDSYLLVSKNNSELYILDKNHPEKTLKVTDYHKPSFQLTYGGGYGGY